MSNRQKILFIIIVVCVLVLVVITGWWVTEDMTDPQPKPKHHPQPTVTQTVTLTKSVASVGRKPELHTTEGTQPVVYYHPRLTQVTQQANTVTVQVQGNGGAVLFLVDGKPARYFWLTQNDGCILGHANGVDDWLSQEQYAVYIPEKGVHTVEVREIVDGITLHGTETLSVTVTETNSVGYWSNKFGFEIDKD